MVRLTLLAVTLSISWSALLPTVVEAGECFGNGTTCGTAAQTISSVNAGAVGSQPIDIYQIGSDYFLFANGRSDWSSPYQQLIFKWQPAQRCFGSGTTCGGVFQAFDRAPSNYSLMYGSIPFSVDGNSYLVIADIGSSPYYSKLYRWQSAQQCFGSGTTCGTALQTLTSSSFAIGEVFVSGGITYLTDTYRTYRWQSAQQCFGNGTTCGSAVQSQTLPMFSNTNLSMSMTYIGSVPFLFRGGNSNTNSAHVHQWQSAQQCFGNGTTCSASKQALSEMYVDDTAPFSVGGNQYVVWNNGNIYKWQSAQQCLGNGTTCGSVFQDIKPSGGSSYYDLHAFTNGSDTFLIRWENTTTRLYKWITTQNCFGDDSICSNTGGVERSVYSLPRIAYESATFSVGTSTYAVLGHGTTLGVYLVHKPPPACTISLSPNPINGGQSSLLTWDSTNADTLYIRNVGYVNATGSTSVAPSMTTSYAATSTNSGGSVACTGTATLNVYQSCTFSGGSVMHGQSVTAYQSSLVPYGSSCVSQTRTCNNGTLSGTYSNASCAVSAIPPPPTVSLIIDPLIVYRDGTANVSWSSTGADSCTVAGGGDSWTGTASPAGGRTTSPLKGEVTYTLTCQNAGGSTSASSTVKILPFLQET